MKAARFREDGYGAIVGRLRLPNEIQYENDGRLGTFQLTGNVLETEYNDVALLGRRLSEYAFEVDDMESLEIDDVLYFETKNTEEPCYLLIIPKDLVTEIKKEVIPGGMKVKNILVVNGGKNHNLNLTTIGEWRPDIANKSYVFLLRKEITTIENEFGSGYAIKKVKTDYAAGIQLLS